ncbi:EI24 domain-containing protein [Campylobacter showae]|uniref:EI24 domain-containing protein n=1 Tax=Campylobacter showae TaxID=204 RepID=UPI0026EA56F5|nr:EI24 domain-containing protein [Campylobacter showae]
MFADILRLSIKDLFTPKFIALSILPLVFSALIIAAIAMLGGRELYEALNAAVSGETGALAEYPMVAKILSLGIAKWLIGAIFYAVGAYLVVMLSVFCALAVAGFLTPTIAREINRRHYRVDEAQLANVSLARQTALMGQILLKFFLIALICVPILAVPALNFLALHPAFFYLYYSLLFIDVAPNALSRHKFELYLLDYGGYKFKAAALCFYLLCLVPIFGLFLQVFFVIYFSHFFFLRETSRLT